MSRLQVIKGGEAMGMGLADYLWVNDDGFVCFKKKTILVGKNDRGEPAPLLPRWSFAACGCLDDECEGGDDACPNTVNRVLSPCFYLPDPTRPQPCYLVLCELRSETDQAIDARSRLRKALKARGPTAKLLWFGFEQDYQLQDADESGRVVGLSERRFLTTERHFGACFDAGLMIHSIWNSLGHDVWDFKVGVRGFPQDLDPDPPSAMVVSDHLMVAQYLMEKIGAEKGLQPDWRNLSLFISTPHLREPGQGYLQEADRLLDVLSGDGRTLRKVPHPTHGGVQCIEVALNQYENPYELSLSVLEAVWPLEMTTEAPTEEKPE